VFVSFGFTDVLALQTEGLYSQRGFSLTEGTSKLTAEFDGFAIPLLLKFMFPTE